MILLKKKSINDAQQVVVLSFCKTVCWFIAYHSVFLWRCQERDKCSTTTLLTNVYTEINQMVKV